MTMYDKIRDGSSLAVVLTENLPDEFTNDHGWVSPTKLGAALGCAKQNVAKWISTNRIPSNRVNPLIRLPGSTLTKKMLLEFVDLG